MNNSNDQRIRAATPWQEATASGSSGGQCVSQRGVETVDGRTLIQVRHSKDPAGGVLTMDPATYAAWIAGAKAGEFDHLLR